jgi:hypothetical protein
MRESIRMILIAKGFITKPDAPAPYVDDEMRVVGDLKGEGVITALYRRAAGPGVYLMLAGTSIDAAARPNGHPAVCHRGPDDP